MEPIPESSLILTGSTAEEKFRLEALMTYDDFCKANTQREQISTAVKHLRPSGNGQRFTLEQIGRLLEGLKA